MEHVAIDLGGRESQICVRSRSGAIVEERRCATASLGAYLRRRPQSRVILETCAEGFAVADQALALGHEVRVVPGTLVRSLGVGARGVKTDQRDARILSEVSSRVDLPTVHIPTQRSRELKTMCGMREALVQARTKLINTVRGWMRANATRVRRGGADTFGARVRAHFGAELPGYVDRQVGTIENLTREICEADRRVTQCAKQDALCRRLMTVPGVGPVTALRFVSAIDEITRFPNAHAVQAYIGLVPGECSSSDRKRRTSITKAGSPRLRWSLIQAAWAARRCAARNLDPMVLWSQQVELRRGKRIAIVALARKIAGILYAMWRDGSTYEPVRSLEDRHP